MQKRAHTLTVNEPTGERDELTRVSRDLFGIGRVGGGSATLFELFPGERIISAMAGM